MCIWHLVLCFSLSSRTLFDLGRRFWSNKVNYHSKYKLKEQKMKEAWCLAFRKGKCRVRSARAAFSHCNPVTVPTAPIRPLLPHSCLTQSWLASLKNFRNMRAREVAQLVSRVQDWNGHHSARSCMCLNLSHQFRYGLTLLSLQVLKGDDGSTAVGRTLVFLSHISEEAKVSSKSLEVSGILMKLHV